MGQSPSRSKAGLGWAGSVGLGINKLLGRIWDVCDVFIYILIDNNKFI